MTKFKIIVLIALLVTSVSCDVLKQATELTSFVKCKFRLHTIENLKLAGVNIQEKKSMSDLSFLDAAKLTAALSSNKLPMSFVLNIQVQNPNQNQAAMNRLDWQLFIDETEITQGILSQRLEIPANETGTLPLLLTFDLKEVFKKESGNSLLNLVFNLVGAGNEPSHISLKAKPTIIVGTREIVYPGYITISNEFNSY